MEQVLRKYSRVITLGFISLFAVMLALVLNEFIAVQLAPLTVPEFAKVTPPKTSAPPKSLTQDYKTAVVERCLFGCVDAVDPNVCPGGCGDNEVCQSGACVPLSEEAPVDTNVAVASDLNVKLVGCMVAKKPEYSLALVTENATKATYIVGVGDQLLDSEVIEIRRDRVMVRRNARVEYIAIVDALAGSPSFASSPLINRSAAAAAAMDIKPNTAILSPSITAASEVIQKEQAMATEGVRVVGKNTYEIDRKTINDQLSNPEVLAKQAQIVPNYKEGKNHGIKLIGIQPSSVYSKIGIRNGDIIIGIGGQKIDSQARALALLDGMRSKNNVKIDIERGGKTETVEYTVK